MAAGLARNLGAGEVTFEVGVDGARNVGSQVIALAYVVVRQ